jgi:hypothetical protein
MGTGLYFSERERGTEPQDQQEVSQAFWSGLIGFIQARLADGTFAESFPLTCFESPLPVDCNTEALQLAVKGEHPEIPWPLVATSTVPPTLAILDLVEFFHRHVSRPTQRSYHDYGRHHHFLTFDRQIGKAEYCEAINSLFRRNRHPYELREDGKVHRLPLPVLAQLLASIQFRTGDDGLNQLLNQAIDRFQDPRPDLRKDSLEKLWDAWERLKTLYPGDKKASTENLLAVAVGDPNFRSRIETEARELTDVGNKFMIRHAETDKIPITSDRQIDYLFHRLFALMWLLLGETGRLS